MALGRTSFAEQMCELGRYRDVLLADDGVDGDTLCLRR